MHISTNRLSLDKNEYLQARAKDLVHWYAWGDKAREAAKKIQKPLLLHFGSIDSFFCALMGSECFQDEEVSTFLNFHFINVAICVHENPEVFEFFVAASKILSGIDEIPLTLILTPDLNAFFSTSAFDRTRENDFLTMVQNASRFFEESHVECQKKAAENTERMLFRFKQLSSGVALGSLGFQAGVFDHRAVQSSLEPAVIKLRSFLLQRRDSKNFGFNFSTKQAYCAYLKACMHNEFSSELNAHAYLTLLRMQSSELHDHIDGGFFKKCFSDDWSFPVLEKPLELNQELMSVFAVASIQFSEPSFKETAKRIFDFLVENYKERNSQLLVSAYSFEQDSRVLDYFEPVPEKVQKHFSSNIKLFRFAQLLFSLGFKSDSRQQTASQLALPQDFERFCSANDFSLAEGKEFLKEVLKSSKMERSSQEKPVPVSFVTLRANADFAAACLVSGLCLVDQAIYLEGIRVLNRLLGTFVSGKKLLRYWNLKESQVSLHLLSNLDDAANLLCSLTLAFLTSGDVSFAKAISFTVDWIDSQYFESETKSLLYVAKSSHSDQDFPKLRDLVVADVSFERSSPIVKIANCLRLLPQAKLTSFESLFNSEFIVKCERLHAAAACTAAMLFRTAPETCASMLPYLDNPMGTKLEPQVGKKFEERAYFFQTSLTEFVKLW